MRSSIILLLIFISIQSQSQVVTSEFQLKKLPDHPMQYYIALPEGWNKNKLWPVVMIFEAAEKEYKVNAERFRTVRGSSPFILVAPIHTNNGNQGRRDQHVFPYSNETWDYIDKVGDCVFNDSGINSIINQVTREYNGDPKVYLTGFEAGAHQLFAILFNHPDWVLGAAPVAANFRSRCVADTSLPKGNELAKVNLFVGENDHAFGKGSQLFEQWLAAKSLLIKQGFTSVNETVVSGKDHTPMPQEVMNYFTGLLKK